MRQLLEKADHKDLAKPQCEGKNEAQNEPDLTAMARQTYCRQTTVLFA